MKYLRLVENEMEAKNLFESFFHYEGTNVPFIIELTKEGDTHWVSPSEIKRINSIPYGIEMCEEVISQQLNAVVKLLSSKEIHLSIGGKEHFDKITSKCFGKGKGENPYPMYLVLRKA